MHVWDDKLGHQTFTFKPYGYLPDPSGDYVSLNGTKLSKTPGNHKDNSNAYESDLNEEVRTLIDLYYESDLVSEGHVDFFFDIETTHFAAELIPFLSKVSKDNLKKSVFIHLRKDFFDLFIYQGSQLLFFNSFPKNNEEEFLYYLFFVLEQFYLRANQFVAIFLGKFLEYKGYYKVFEEFHSITNFTFPEILKFNSNHPAPFFSYFNNYENNIRKV